MDQIQYKGSKIDCLIFDLDDTLYPLTVGFADAVTKNIGEFMVGRLGIDRSEYEKLSNLLYKNYGTTMAGIRAIGYSFNYDEYHRCISTKNTRNAKHIHLEKVGLYLSLDWWRVWAYVVNDCLLISTIRCFIHGRLPYENLKPDPVLKQLLLSLPIRKVIFTNGDKEHARKSLERLGLEDCFEQIICFETLNLPIESKEIGKENIFDIVKHLLNPDPIAELPKTPVVCKPSEDAIKHALKIANIDPKRAIFFDDSVRNIQAGKRAGLRTVLVGRSQKAEGADHALENIHNIRKELPELWEQVGKTEDGVVKFTKIENGITA